MALRFFDTHLHLDDAAFGSDPSSVVERAQAVGVTAMVAVGTTADSSVAAVQLAARFPAVYAAVGIQPNHVAEATEACWDRIVALARLPKVVALGETGLDHYWDYAPVDLQLAWFERHLLLAMDCGLPFIVHSREGKHGTAPGQCTSDIVSAIRRIHGGRAAVGIMHSFTGTLEQADTCLALGLYLSFAGMVTFKKAQDLREVAARVADPRILIETDAPYLAPHPLRGTFPNEPCHLVHTAACLAELRGSSLTAFGELTAANACRVFGLHEDALAIHPSVGP